MQININDIVTLGEIAARLGVPRHQVTYYLKTRKIKPIRRLGRVRLFLPEVIEKLRAEIKGTSEIATIEA